MRLSVRAGSPRRDQQGSIFLAVRLNEQFAECRMRRMGVRVIEHDLEISRDLDLAHLRAMIREPQPAPLERCLRQHLEFEACAELTVAALEHRCAGLERQRAGLAPGQRRPAGGPQA